MKKILFLFSLLSLSVLGFSQITLESGAQLIISSGSTVIANDGIVNNDGSINNSGTVEIKGNLENNTSALIASSSTGTVKFNGSAAQEITGTADADFYGTVEIDNANGVALTATAAGSDQTINGDLTFTNGLLTLNGFNLTLGTNDPTGVGSAAYVQTNSTGFLKRNVPADGATDITFPVGNGAYNPVTLQNSAAATADNYNVRVVDAEPAAGSTDHFVDRSWAITEDVALGSDLTITPQWNGAEELTDFDRTNASVGLTTDAGSTYTWADLAAATGTDPYTVAGSGFSDVGTFTVGDYFNAGKTLNLKLFLAGAYNGTTMNKTLNTSGLIPTIDPYGLEPLTNTPTPTDAVDWVKVELRDQTTPSTVLHSFAFFVDVNGNLLDRDGSTGGKMTGFDNSVPYYITVTHRNHFGIMTSSTMDLSVTNPNFDYTTAQAKAWQDGGISTNPAMKDISGVFCLWDGNAKYDNILRYNGTDNDRSEILNALPNEGSTVAGYAISDLNMDGITRYNGTDNDRSVILNNIPNEGSTFYQHLP